MLGVPAMAFVRASVKGEQQKSKFWWKFRIAKG